MAQCPRCRNRIESKRDVGQISMVCGTCNASFDARHLFAFPDHSTPVAPPRFQDNGVWSIAYLAWFSTTDARSNPLHLELELLGLDGTNIFRLDDPFLTPWFLARELGYRQCRCCPSRMTAYMAAQRGVKEAVEWRDTGRMPTKPEWVRIDPSFRPFEPDNDCELLGWDGGDADTHYRYHPGNPDSSEGGSEKYERRPDILRDFHQRWLARREP